MLRRYLEANCNQLIFFCICVLLFEGLVYLASLDIPHWGDEEHFVRTTIRFGNELNLNTLKHYDEMSPPLPFVLYSIWGRIFGFDLDVLRIFSVLIAIVSYLLFYKLLYSIFGEGKIPWLAGAFLVLHPYMIGLSVFVFTDMFAILFLLIACDSIIRHREVVLAVSLSSGVLCRQYMIFFVLAVGLYYLFRCHTKEGYDRRAFAMLLSSFLSLVPLATLFFLWKGVSPDNQLRYLYLKEDYSFHPSFLTLYVCLFFVYLLPIIVVCWKSIYEDAKVLLGCFVVSWSYWLFPVRPCTPQTDANISTVGFFHKFLRVIIGREVLEDTVFYMTFLLGLPVAFYFLRDAYLKLKTRTFDFSFLLDISILTFLLVMPFSYLCWEKYFLPLLPLATMRILLIKYSALHGGARTC